MNTPVKRGRGRPTSFGPEAAAMAASGATLAEIARHFGVGFRAVCTDWTRRYPDFKAAVERGRVLRAERRRMEAAAKAAAERPAREARETKRAVTHGIPLKPVPVAVPADTAPTEAATGSRAAAKRPITSTGTRTPDMPRWHERQRAARIAAGEDPPPLPARRPAPVRRELPDYCWPRDDDEPYDPLAEWR